MYKGKAIYSPKGKAAEYSKYACNFYIGCSNGCTYCYLKKGRGSKVLGGDKPTLKKCFKDEAHALEIFENEMLIKRKELRKNGLFFSFTTDPMLRETKLLTTAAVYLCNINKIPVKILTKRTDYIYQLGLSNDVDRQLIAIGLTITGHDELEPNASPTEQRINALRYSKISGYKTFVSIEPLIEVTEALKIMEKTINYVDLYKIGLESGKKYKAEDIKWFLYFVIKTFRNSKTKIYLKESLRKLIEYENKTFKDLFVDFDFNLFSHEK